MFGTYAHDAACSTLTLRTDSATFPNWDGTEQKRTLLSFACSELKYGIPPDACPQN
jgi:hypothetical protein